VDVRQAARVIAPRDAAPPAPSTASAGGLVPRPPPRASCVTAGLGEPRKVRTVSIRPEPAPPSSAPMRPSPPRFQTPIQAQARSPRPQPPPRPRPPSRRSPDPIPAPPRPRPARRPRSPWPRPCPRAPAPAASKAPSGWPPSATFRRPAPVPAGARGRRFAVQLSVGAPTRTPARSSASSSRKHNAELGSRLAADRQGRRQRPHDLPGARRRGHPRGRQALCSASARAASSASWRRTSRRGTRGVEFADIGSNLHARPPPRIDPGRCGEGRVGCRRESGVRDDASGASCRMLPGDAVAADNHPRPLP
jgi:hypothetical protein